MTDLDRARTVLADLQAWQDVVAEAKQCYRFKSFIEASDWFQTVPRFLPKQKRIRWLVDQKAQAFGRDLEHKRQQKQIRQFTHQRLMRGLEIMERIQKVG